MDRTADATRAHVVEDQGAVFDFLADPATHGLAEAPVRIDTHGAAVFLAGADAWKVKRAVRFPYMDFSTLEKRRVACAREVEINGPGAPGIYLGAVPVVRRDGRLRLGGDGEVVEWAVHMRRFDETATLDLVADRGELGAATIVALVHAIHAAHERAPLGDGLAAADSLVHYVAQNRVAFAENADVFPPGRAHALSERMAAELRHLRDLLVGRGRAGRVRRCHGDLHLANVALIDGRPTLFDAIEFDDGIATCDVLYDFAYLVMDLIERGLPDLAALAVSRYLAAAPDVDLDGVAAMPIFLALRATIRAKVIAAGLPNLAEAARPAAATAALRYFAVAERVLEPVPPQLVAIGGLSGSGKSTVAAALASHVGRAPGAVHLRSDVIRKRLAGVAETDRLPVEHYADPASHAAVFATLNGSAARLLAAGSSVIVDAVHGRPQDRAEVEAVAAAAGVPFTGLFLDAPLDVRLARVDARRADASDAGAAVVLRQAGYELHDVDWMRIDAAAALDVCVADALAVLQPGDHGRPT
ncbi:AAA family ATPase [Oharaeibacter diazotrophicus]|uniref:Uncharacterized protein n=1 Tax=Oharaeibacter diazotrophicus TaxID=1920512 RepID=A0A4R6RL35_9HYPH|nr:AAA family ATPase [Oharaeibacter diazotrophicus]TDP86416.1 hypothetical protein EDD54_0287 [Oharaeibacter diazotrophicus]BBE71641.1 adenylyl-sulfate kinase [Pleomorphomonas sp. SM30]GLS78406.1 hypothetical protein GCM10007904_37430 [Oharaeibacter diazotrophicus]